MIFKGTLPVAMAVAGIILAGAVSLASASVDRMPRLQAQCLSTKQVLKTSGGARLADIQPGGKVKLVSVRVCTAERRACFALGDEVPISLCAKG